MNTAIYCRVSTEEQRKGDTIASQISELEKHASNEKIEINNRYIDNGWSGSILSRPALDKLRDDIRSKLISTLLMLHPDRLSRKQLHQLMLLDEFQRAGIKVIFTTQPGLDEQSEESQIITKTVLAMNSELERIRIRDRFRRGRLHKAELGHVVTSKAPYGYRYVNGDRSSKQYGYFQVEPKEIDTLKLILQLAKEGYSEGKIIKELQVRDIKTRNGKETWAKSTICKILTTNLDVYAGTWHYMKYVSVEPQNTQKKSQYIQREKTSRKLRDKCDWIGINLGSSLTVIYPSDVELIRENRKKNLATNRGNTKYQYLLQKMVYCSSCKGLCYCDSFHQIPYYRCANRKRMFPNPPTCKVGSTKATDLELEVWNALIGVISDRDIVEKTLNDFTKQGASNSPNELENIENKINKLKLQMERIVVAYREGIIDLFELKKQKTFLQNQIVKVQVMQQDLEKQTPKINSENINDLQMDISGFIQDLVTVMRELSQPEKRKLLEWFSLRVFTDFNEFRIEGSIPYVQNSDHNIFMQGAPGAGKTMLARTIPSILPDLTEEELLDVTRIYSVTGNLPQGESLVRTRPFRSPHHTTSRIGLIGGGTHPTPGEISLAHRGVLFLDEFPEYPRHVLEALRQPMEDGIVTIARAAGSVTYPAKFLLIAAANPCPCGNYGSETLRCTCPPLLVARYQRKISGPMLDRIDLHVWVPQVKTQALLSDNATDRETSASMKRRIDQARLLQLERLSRYKLTANSEMTSRMVKECCRLLPDVKHFLEIAMNKMKLSARASFRVLKVSRTIADLEESADILVPHIAEALQYRVRRRMEQTT